MNKLIFHEGGQPVYLNDLQMLQEQFADMIGSFILSLTVLPGKSLNVISTHIGR